MGVEFRIGLGRAPAQAFGLDQAREALGLDRMPFGPAGAALVPALPVGDSDGEGPPGLAASSDESLDGDFRPPISSADEFSDPHADSADESFGKGKGKGRGKGKGKSLRRAAHKGQGKSLGKDKGKGKGKGTGPGDGGGGGGLPPASSSGFGP